MALFVPVPAPAAECHQQDADVHFYPARCLGVIFLLLVFIPFLICGCARSDRLSYEGKTLPSKDRLFRFLAALFSISSSTEPSLGTRHRPHVTALHSACPHHCSGASSANHAVTSGAGATSLWLTRRPQERSPRPRSPSPPLAAVPVGS